MLQAGLLVLLMGRFEYFNKYLYFGLGNSCNLARDFLYRPGFYLGHKCLEIIVISDPVSRRPESLEPLILTFICGRAY